MLRSLVLPAVAAGAFLTGVHQPAFAQLDSDCLEEMAAVEAAHLGVLEHLSSFELRSLATLRNAGRVLARYEREDTCEELAETMGEILSERREELIEAGLMVEVDDQARIEQLETAPKVDQLVAPLRAGNIIGGALRNTRDQYLGEIDDVVFDPDGSRITHALVEVGGFLGIGEDIVAVPLSALRVTDSMNTYVVDMTKERFEEAPRLEGDMIGQTDNLDWREKNDMYFVLPEEE